MSRTPATPKPSKAKLLKKLWKTETKKIGHSISLKAFAKTNEEVKDSIGSVWLHNKRANFSKPPLGLGSTRKKKGQGGKK